MVTINIVERRAGAALVLLSIMIAVGSSITPFVVDAFVHVPGIGVNNLTMTLTNDTNLTVTYVNSK